MEARKLTRQEATEIQGGALGLLGTLLTFGVMLIPSLITSGVQAGLMIKREVDGKETETAQYGSAQAAPSGPRPYIRMSPVASRSTVAYGMPF